MSRLVSTLESRGWGYLLTQHPEAALDYMRLDGLQQPIIIRWLTTHDEITAQKVISRSMRYFLTGAVSPRSDGGFDVQGDHTGQKDPYIVYRDRRGCNCDRATGKGKYQNRKGPCSHMCAVELHVNRIGRG